MKALPEGYDERKALPLYDFMFGYFPLAWLEVVKVAVEGNKQHNPGERLHWARGKSMDQLNTAFRHLFDHGTGTVRDTDGCMHLAKTVWRLMAEMQLIREKELGEQEVRHTRPHTLPKRRLPRVPTRKQKAGPARRRKGPRSHNVRAGRA